MLSGKRKFKFKLMSDGHFTTVGRLTSFGRQTYVGGVKSIGRVNPLVGLLVFVEGCIVERRC
jgi:hypothetical protein